MCCYYRNNKYQNECINIDPYVFILQLSNPL